MIFIVAGIVLAVVGLLTAISSYRSKTPETIGVVNPRAAYKRSHEPLPVPPPEEVYHKPSSAPQFNAIDQTGNLVMVPDTTNVDHHYKSNVCIPSTERTETCAVETSTTVSDCQPSQSSDYSSSSDCSSSSSSSGSGSWE